MCDEARGKRDQAKEGECEEMRFKRNQAKTRGVCKERKKQRFVEDIADLIQGHKNERRSRKKRLFC